MIKVMRLLLLFLLSCSIYCAHSFPVNTRYSSSYYDQRNQLQQFQQQRYQPQRFPNFYGNRRAQMIYQNLDPTELAELASGVVNMAAFLGKAASPENAEILDLAPKVFTALKPEASQRKARAATSRPPWMSVIGSFLPNNIPLRLENGRPTLRLRDVGNNAGGPEFNLATLWGGGQQSPDYHTQEVVPTKTTTNKQPTGTNPLNALIGGAGGPLAEIFKGFGGGDGPGQLLLKPLTEGIGAPIGTAFGLEANSGRDSVGEDPSEDLVKVWGSDDAPVRTQAQPSFFRAPIRRGPRGKREISDPGSKVNFEPRRRRKRAAGDMQFLTSFIPGLFGGSSSNAFDPFAQSLLNPENLLEFLTNQGDQNFASGLARGVKSSLSNNDLSSWLWLDPSGGVASTSQKSSAESIGGNGKSRGLSWTSDGGSGSVISPKFGAINTKHVNKFRRSGVPIISDSENSIEHFFAHKGPGILNELLHGFGGASSSSSTLNFGNIAKSLLPEEARPFVDIIANMRTANALSQKPISNPSNTHSRVQISRIDDRDLDTDSVDIDKGSGHTTSDDPYYNFYED